MTSNIKSLLIRIALNPRYPKNTLYKYAMAKDAFKLNTSSYILTLLFISEVLLDSVRQCSILYIGFDN